MRRRLDSLAIFLATASLALGQRAHVPHKPMSPYRGAIAIDSAGRVLAEDNADRLAHPASVVKLMTLLVIVEQIEQNQLTLSQKITATREAQSMGGSQVNLEAGEVFTVDELLYAMIIHSANDAAVALAAHISGSREDFVPLMNRRARELGMKNTVFHSVHGLPPSDGQKPDVTTARDLALLSRELCKHRLAFRYTSARRHPFRNGTLTMVTHNHLLKRVEGCDGLKTGWTRKAGYSMAVTAKRGSRRVIAVVVGATSRKQRDAEATKLIAKGFSVSATTALPPVIDPLDSQPAPPASDTAPSDAPPTSTRDSKGAPSWLLIGGGCVLLLLLLRVITQRRFNGFDTY